MTIKHQHFRTECMVNVSRAYGLSRREASLRPARARRSHDHLGTDSVESKLPSLYVPVNPSPVSREASRDLSRSIGPSTMVGFELRTLLSVRIYIIPGLVFMFRAKRPLYLRHMSDIDKTAGTGVSGERGRRKTAELHTSGGKRAETWRGGVK